MFDDVVLVLLRMDKHFLSTQLVLEPQLVEAITLVGLALDGHAGFVVGQVVGRQLVTAIGAPGDHRLVGVAVDVLDDHVLPDAWDGHRSPTATCPPLGYPHPAGAELVVVALPVPREADLDPAPFVAVDLLARRADHGCHVRAIDSRLVQRRGAPFGSAGYQLGGLLIACALIDAGCFFLEAGELAALVSHAVHAPMHI